MIRALDRQPSIHPTESRGRPFHSSTRHRRFRRAISHPIAQSGVYIQYTLSITSLIAQTPKRLSAKVIQLSASIPSVLYTHIEKNFPRKFKITASVNNAHTLRSFIHPTTHADDDTKPLSYTFNARCVRNETKRNETKRNEETTVQPAFLFNLLRSQIFALKDDDADDDDATCVCDENDAKRITTRARATNDVRFAADSDDARSVCRG